MSAGCSVYNQPEEDFFDLYKDEAYDLCLLDDFEGKISIQSVLCRFLQGYKGITLRRKGQPPVIKNKYLPTIITSNYDIDDLPITPSAKAALSSRVTKIRVGYPHGDLNKQFIFY